MAGTEKRVTPAVGGDRKHLSDEELAALGAGGCRECRDQEPPVHSPADFILWGKLFPPEALGPRCRDHAAAHIGWSGMSMIDQFAVYDLRKVQRILAELVRLRADNEHRQDEGETK